MSESSSIVQIKGMRDSLLVSLSDAPWEEQRAALLAQIDGQPAFFQGARLALDVGSQALKVNDMVQLRDHLSERNISLWAVVSESATTEKTAQLLGLATRVSRPRPEEQRVIPLQEITDETALFLNKTVRSGTRVEFGGHVVVLGDVNPGAEIVADGSVIVFVDEPGTQRLLWRGVVTEETRSADRDAAIRTASEMARDIVARFPQRAGSK